MESIPIQMMAIERTFKESKKVSKDASKFGPESSSLATDDASEPSSSTGSGNSKSSSSSSLLMGRFQNPSCVPEFIYQLMRMLQNNSEVIQWGKACIVVHDPHRLEGEVLQHYFRHGNFASFQRQLNYFGFRKMAGKEKMSPCSFISDEVTDDLNSLLLIKRKRINNSTSKRSKVGECKIRSSSISSFSSESSSSSVNKKIRNTILLEHSAKSESLKLSSQALEVSNHNKVTLTVEISSDCGKATLMLSAPVKPRGGDGNDNHLVDFSEHYHGFSSTTCLSDKACLTTSCHGEHHEGIVMIHASSSLMDLAFLPPPSS